jgi:D-alanyl-D-alanine carboxypeptidase
LEVTTGGIPSLRGINLSGRNIRNNSTFVQSAQNVAIAPLAETGFISAVNASNGSLRMHTWENLVVSCVGPGGCQYVSSNISNETIDQSPNVPGVQVALPTVVSTRAMLRDPLYQNDLFTLNPDTVQSIASVRKAMVTIVALDAVAAGEVSLDDLVTVSAAAAAVNNTSASAMGLQGGEVISLRNLLYGNMMVSGGDATWAISEYVGGSLAGMVTRMNQKATALGMTNTTHCQQGNTFSSVSYSTARDQATLWKSVYDDPLFLEFAGAASEEVCGTLPGNVEICHPTIPPMTKNMNQYPNHEGDKTGSTGGLCSNLVQFTGILRCTSNGCLSAQSTRLGRPLLLTELQPTGQTGNIWPDARNLWDYGYRQIFTPDFRVDSSNQGGTAVDFGLDYLTDTHAISAAITGNKRLMLCNWTTEVDGSAITRGGCSERDFNNLAPGPRQTPATRLEMVRISTLEAEGDYLLGRLEGNNLTLRLWRIGQK